MLNVYETTLKEVCGSQSRYRLLRALFEGGGNEYHLRGLAAAAHVDPGHVSKLLPRLIKSGLCEQVSAQPYAKYRARRDNPLYSPLVRIFTEGSKLVSDLREAADKELSGTVAIFGSVAAGTDRPGSDVDVLVIGEMSAVRGQAALKPVGRKHGRQINATVIGVKELERELAHGSVMWREIVGGPLILLKGKIPHADRGAVP